MKVRFNAYGNSFPWLRVVVGFAAALFGLYGVATYGIRYWSGDFWATVAMVAIGIPLGLWGAWRVNHPARWIELDTEARTLTFGGGGPLISVPLSEVVALELKDVVVPVRRGYRSYPCVVASGLPGKHLYAGLSNAKAHARKAELEALLK